MSANVRHLPLHITQGCEAPTVRTADLLEKCRQAGVEIRRQGDKLSVKAAKGGLSPELAALIRTEKAAILAFLANASVDRETLVLPLREGGTNVPLYCVCGIALYQDLADALGEGQPVYGLFVASESAMFSEPGAVGSKVTVQDLSAAYIAAMRTHRPRGPYALCGISFGGILAFEMARQLVAAGDEVVVLGLLDAVLPRGTQRSVGSWVTGHLRRLANQGPQYLFDRVGAEVSGHREDPPLRATAIPDDPQKLEELREQIYLRAMADYDATMQVFSGRAIVFRAMDQSAFVGYEVDRACGWAGLATAGVVIHDVAGDHLGIIADSNVAGLAKVLRGYLDRASAG